MAISNEEDLRDPPPSTETAILSAMEAWGGHIPRDVPTEMLRGWWFGCQQWLARASENRVLLSFEKALEEEYGNRGLGTPARFRSVPSGWSAEELERQRAENQNELAKDPADWDALITQDVIKRQYGRRGMIPPEKENL